MISSFSTSTGRGLDYRKVGEAFRLAVRRTGIREDGRLSLYSLRHGFASLLIAEGLDVVFVSRQLGHADPSRPPSDTRRTPAGRPAGVRR